MTAPEPGAATPAQEQATILAALAAHLRANPGLDPVVIHPAGYERPATLQVAIGDDALLEWGRSVGVTQWRVTRNSAGAVYLRADTEFGELLGLVRALTDTDYAQGEVIAAGDLQ